MKSRIKSLFSKNEKEEDLLKERIRNKKGEYEKQLSSNKSMISELKQK